MESTYLLTLIEVARTGSLTKAAEVLCVTQSAVSRRVKYLEDQYGHQLLDRSGSTLQPTSEGVLVLEKAQKIIEIERELLSGLNSLDNKKGFSFLCTPTFGIVHLPDVLREFMLNCADAGDLKFVFDMPEKIIKSLKDGRYEMAIVEHCECLDLSDFETLALTGDQMIFAGATSLPLEEKISVETLLTHTLFGRDEGCCSRLLLENNLAALGHSTSEFSRVIIFDDLNLIVQAVIRGEGVAFISSELVQPYIDLGQLTVFKVPGFNHQRRRTLVFNSNFADHGLANKFKKILLERFALPPC